jgi:hypothetical protein
MGRSEASSAEMLERLVVTPDLSPFPHPVVGPGGLHPNPDPLQAQLFELLVCTPTLVHF